MKILLVLIGFFYSTCLCAQSKEIATNNILISPTIFGKINDTVNTVYCSSFIYAWKGLTKFNGKPILFADKSLILDQLNSIKTCNSVNSKFLLAKAGCGKLVIPQIQAELLRRFGKTDKNLVSNETLSIISYAYLRKTLKFYKPFYESMEGSTILFNGKEDVKVFGSYQGGFTTNELVVHNYRNDDDFILQIKIKGNSDDLYLAKIKPDSTLEQTFINIMNRVNLNDSSSIKEGEHVLIPLIQFAIEGNFKELENQEILNSNYTISRALQNIEFNLNESGVSLESSALLEEIWGGYYGKVTRKFCFDKPFIVCLKEHNKTEPYLIIYIANADFMIKQKPRNY